MSKKRRVFDIEFSDEPVAPPAPTEREARRGPMAAAVRETAEALTSRAEIEAQIRAENDRLAHEHVRLKKAGRITDLVPVDQIAVSKLIRDRISDGDDLTELKDSLREIGLSNPIQVEQAGEGSFELVQGFRRLAAYRALLAETGDADRWGAIPAVILASGEALERLYRRMVDENLVRKDISFGEMAILARDYAADPATAISDVDAAVSELFRSAGKQKKSYIRAFARLLSDLGDALRHPQALPRALGLELRKALEAQPGLASTLRAKLSALPETRDAEAEMAVLQEALGAPKQARTQPLGSKSRVAKTTFRLERPRGAAKVTASAGRLEVQLDTDFSAKDRRALEAALAEFLDRLEE
ncbi:ParB/RepB/Spo0J family partition protein [Litorisediminicola beolgyonensis]|uniref:ParB/RepB/Spo0J family partition protein n=1 Tax=Litorisediminicola beolgyonensis TaxID=1173614 RepID=A0ABW3ZIU2_9RHOB